MQALLACDGSHKRHISYYKKHTATGVKTGAQITASKHIRILFGLPIATGCHSFTLRPFWLCVPAFQQVCPVFSFCNIIHFSRVPSILQVRFYQFFSRYLLIGHLPRYTLFIVRNEVRSSRVKGARNLTVPCSRM